MRRSRSVHSFIGVMNSALHAAIPTHIFSTFYPLTLIREFQSITMDAFSGLIGNIEVVAQEPLLDSRPHYLWPNL